MPQIFAFIPTIVFGVFSSWVHGWALAKLWGWFVTPVFPTIPSLTILQAVGISLVMQVLLSSVHMALANLMVATGKKNDDTFIESMTKSAVRAFASIMMSVLGVGMGWIWLQFM